MSLRWALSVPRESATAIARVRPMRGLEILEQRDSLWLRGDWESDDLNRQLHLVPGGRWLAVLTDGQTVPEGKLVPLGQVPSGTWTPLAQWLQVTLPAPAQAAPQSVTPVSLKLVPSAHVRESTLLETSLTDWWRFVETAPQWRIDCWTFVASPDGRVMVRGLPLPPIPGVQWVIEECLAVPAGYSWSPALDALALQQLLGLTAGDLALLRPAGSLDRIAAEEWTVASRCAARATREVLSA